jgi:membrane-bound lytic murein transglycosylase D
VRKGDTVLSVADDFGVPAEKVRQWNRLKGNALRAGRSLTIFKPAAATARTAETGSPSHSRTTASSAKPQHATHTAGKSSGKSTAKSEAKSEAPSKSGKGTSKQSSAKKEVAKTPVKTVPSRSKKHKQQG